METSLFPYSANTFGIIIIAILQALEFANSGNGLSAKIAPKATSHACKAVLPVMTNNLDKGSNPIYMGIV